MRYYIPRYIFIDDINESWLYYTYNMSDLEVYSNDKYIYFAINALEFLRTKPDEDPELREFTYIVVQMIIEMDKWEDVRQHDDCCSVIMYALEEWEKLGFGRTSDICKFHYRKMLKDLRGWCAEAEAKVNNEKN